MPDFLAGLGLNDGKIEMKDMDIKKTYIPEKYKNVQALSFTTKNKELVISFDGFEEDDDLKEFADYVFSKIRMRYWHQENGPPTYH